MTIVELSPLTTVMLCANIPFDSTYTHTMTFGSTASQLAYFQGKSKFTFQNMTPVRGTPNKLRIPENSMNVYGCNYVCFQNANFSNKWFYGFITDIEYFNPNCTEITVELDVFQTWMFDYTVGTSYVVREHPTTDEYGEHTLLEPIEVSEFVDEAAQKSGHLTTYDLVLMYAKDGEAGAGFQGGIFTGLTYDRVPEVAPAAMINLLKQLSDDGKSQEVVASFIFPRDFYTSEMEAVEYELTVPKQITSLGDYVPRNKKLLCYPYNMLNVSNSMGQVNSYKYEYFYNLGSAALFRMSCAMGAFPEVVIWPLSYNGKAENFQETMSLSGFPQFAFVHDTYKQWLAQNGNTFAMQQLSNFTRSGLSAISGAVMGNPLQVVNSVADAGLNLATGMVSLAEKSNLPNTSQGSQGTNTMAAIKAKDFYFYQHHIREDYAAVIDDYFDRFGYLTNRLKIPNITGRPNYNYVRCDAPDIRGNIPLGDINIIKNCFERGITFWHSDNVGNYALKNIPTKGGD